MRTIAEFYASAKAAGMLAAATWTPAGGSPAAIDGYFDAVSGPVLGLEGARPSLRVPTSAVPNVAQNDALTINGVAYAVAEIAPDTPDPGELVLWLRRT